MKKETYKGYTEEDIAGMNMGDFAKLTTSRERRTLKNMKRNPVLLKLVNKVKSIREGPKKDSVIKTRIRDAIILPEWMGLTFGVYNGKEYRRVKITVNHLGKRLGDFAHTTGPVRHSGPGVGATRGSKFVPIK